MGETDCRGHIVCRYCRFSRFIEDGAPPPTGHWECRVGDNPGEVDPDVAECEYGESRAVSARMGEMSETLEQWFSRMVRQDCNTLEWWQEMATIEHGERVEAEARAEKAERERDALMSESESRRIEIVDLRASLRRKEG